MHDLLTTKFGDVFVAAELQQTVDLLAKQGTQILSEANVSIPDRCVSVLMSIRVKQSTTLTHLVATLPLSRQLIIQRLRLLSEAGLVESKTYPNDRRMKILRLTRAGSQQAKKIESALPHVLSALQLLYEEVGFDLGAVARAMNEALDSRSLLNESTPRWRLRMAYQSMFVLGDLSMSNILYFLLSVAIAANPNSMPKVLQHLRDKMATARRAKLSRTSCVSNLKRTQAR